LLLSKLNLSKNNVQFDNLAEKPGKGMDFNHLKIKNLGLIAEELGYGSEASNK
jgi:hypothetical protein